MRWDLIRSRTYRMALQGVLSPGFNTPCPSWGLVSGVELLICPPRSFNSDSESFGLPNKGS